MTGPAPLAPASITVAAAAHPLRTGRIERIVPAGGTLAEILDAVLPDAAAHEARVSIGGVEIPPTLWHRVRPKPGQLVTARAMPQGGGDGKSPVASILMIAVAVASAAFSGPLAAGMLGYQSTAAAAASGFGFTALKTAVGLGMTLAGSMMVNALVPPPSPRLSGGAAGQAASSPTYGLSGVRNVADPYGPVPLLFGRHRVYPKLGAMQYTEHRADDTYLYALFDLGPGPVDIEDLRLGETPIAEIDDIETEFRAGRPGDLPLTLYTRDVHQEPLSIALDDIGHATRRSRPEVDRLSVDLVAPAGLFSVDSETGDRSPRSIAFRVEAEGVDNPLSYIETLTIQANSTSAVRRTVDIPVGRGQYDVTVRRETAGAAPPQANDAVWTALRSVKTEAPVATDGHALLAIRVRASGQLNGALDQVNMIAQRRVRVWDGAQLLEERLDRHPAWAYLDALTGPLVAAPARIPLSRIDLDALKIWADTYPDATFDAYIDFRTTLGELLDDIGAAGRARRAMRDNLYTVIVDAPRSTPVQVFTPRNSRGFQGIRKFLELPHAVRARFVNQEAGWQTDEVLVYRDGYDDTNADPRTFEALDAFGTTVEASAVRQGRYYLAAAALRPETFSIETDAEALAVTRGDLVLVQHDVPLVGVATGRVTVLSLDTEGRIVSLTLDERIPMDAGKTYAARIRLEDMTAVVATLATAAGESATIDLATPLEAPAPGVQVGDLVAVGEAGLETREMLVKEIQARPELGARLILVDHAPEIHAAVDGAPVPAFDPGITRPRSEPPARRPVVRSVRSDDGAAEAHDDGSVTPRIYVAWDFEQAGEVPAVIQVQYRLTGEAFYTALPQLPGEARETWIGPVNIGLAYDVRIRALSAAGVPSAWAEAPGHTVAGPVQAPPAPTGVAVTGEIRGARIATDPPPKRVAYAEVHAGTVDDLTFAGLVGQVFGSAGLITGLMPQRTWYFWVRWVDRSGNPGPFHAPTPGGSPAFVRLAGAEDLDGGAVGDSALAADLAARVDQGAAAAADGPAAIAALRTELDTVAEGLLAAVVRTDGTADYLTRLVETQDEDRARVEVVASIADGTAQLSAELETRVGDAETAIVTVEQTTADQAASLTTLTARVGDAESAITTLDLVTADQVTSHSALETRVGDAETAIAAVEQTTADQASSLTDLTARVGDAESTLQVQAQVSAELGAQYTVKIDVDGHVSGFGLAIETVDGEPVSTFLVRADRFGVGLPTEAGGDPVYPFQIGTVGGIPQLVFSGAMLVEGTHGRVEVAPDGTFLVADGAGNTLLSSGSGVPGVRSGSGQNLVPRQYAWPNALHRPPVTPLGGPASYNDSLASTHGRWPTISWTNGGSAGETGLVLAESTTVYNVPVRPGTTYIASFWAYSHNGNPSVRLRPRRNVDGGYDSAPTFQVPQGVWTRFSFLTTTGGTTTALQLSLLSPDQSAVRIGIDGIAFEEQIAAGSQPTDFAPGGAADDFRITPANVTTIIEGAAIGNAQIGYLSASKITAGQMSGNRIDVGTLHADRIVTNSIDTPQLRSGSVSNGAAASSDSDSSASTAISVSLSTDGGRVYVSGFLRVTVRRSESFGSERNGTVTASAVYHLQRDGSNRAEILRTEASSSGEGWVSVTKDDQTGFAFSEHLAPGTYTYRVRLTSVSGTATKRDAAIWAVEIKR